MKCDECVTRTPPVFSYDLDAIFRDIKEQEKNSGRKFVSFAPSRVESNRAPRLIGPAPAVSDGIPSQPAGPAAEL